MEVVQSPARTRPQLQAQVQSNAPRGPGVSRASAAGLGPRPRISLEDWRLGHTGRRCPGTNADLIGSRGPAAYPGLRPVPHRGGEQVSPPALPASAPPTPPQPLGPTPAQGNWVGREATGRRRLQRDYAPVIRNLSKWTGQAGPLRAQVIKAAAPTPARPGTAGEPGPAAKRGWLAPRLREARAQPGNLGPKATLYIRPPPHTHST